jgi:membrane fusion protein (multidrug efflux system)
LRVGSTARSGSLLGKIISLENLEVEAPVPAQDIPWIDYAEPVILTSSEMPGRWTGRIVRVGSDIDIRTQTAQVFIAVDDSRNGPALNGVFLHAEIPGRPVANAVSIPRKALYDQRYAYVIQDGKLAQREIDIARVETDRVIAGGGIAEGDTLVVEPLQGVAAGMPAQPREIAQVERSR